MAESKENLEQQLDALMREAQAGEEAVRAEPDQAERDTVSAAFADQVQQMLDEAKSAEMGEPAQTDASAAGGGDAVSHGGAMSEEALIGQIDKMLAEQADEALEGQFESVDELLADEEPTDHAKAAGELVEEEEVVVAAGAEQAGEPALSEKAAAVGAELDADEQAMGEGDMESIDDMFPGEEDPSAVLEGSRMMEGSRALASAEEAGEPAAEGSAKRRSVSPVMRTLIALNRPIQNLSAQMRDMVGFIGLQTMLLALVWISFMVGGTVFGISAVVGMTAVGYLAFRKLFLC